MNPGLETRLRTVPGVTAIRIDLGRDGLEGIHVSIDDSSDEQEVLEDIRRILVAYGLRSGVPETPATGVPDSVWLGEIDGETVARLRFGGRRFEGRGEVSWEGAVGAIAEAMATAAGRATPQHVGAIRHQTPETDLVVAVVESEGVKAAGVSLVSDGLAMALVVALRKAMDDLANQLSVDIF